MNEVNLTILFLIAVVASIGFTYRALLLSKQPYKWNTTKGIIHVNKADEFHTFYTRTRGLKVTYDYFVEGKRLTGYMIVFPISERCLIYILKFINEKYVTNSFKDGQEVEVYFNPQKPWQSCLQLNGAEYVWKELFAWCVLLGGFFALISIP